MRGRLIILGIALLVGIPLLWVMARFLSAGVNERSFNKLQAGMSVAEVQHLLGGRADQELETPDFPNPKGEAQPEISHIWVGKSMSIVVNFGDGRLKNACIVEKDGRTRFLFPPIKQ